MSSMAARDQYLTSEHTAALGRFFFFLFFQLVFVSFEASHNLRFDILLTFVPGYQLSYYLTTSQFRCRTRVAEVALTWRTAERGEVTRATLEATLLNYTEAASRGGADEFGKTFFHNSNFSGPGPWYAGRVTPVVHYSMGGLAVDAQGHVLRKESSEAVPGLYAAGEVIGGVHGKNRLGGNALTEYARSYSCIPPFLDNYQPLGSGARQGFLPRVSRRRAWL